MKGDLEEGEYNDMKQDTISQLHEFEKSLQNMRSGNLSLVGHLDHAQFAIQAAIRSAFKTPEVIKMFAKREPAQLRTRLNNIKRDEKLGKLDRDSYNVQAAEILTALKKLGDKLDAEEETFLSSYSAKGLSQFSQSGDSESHSALLSTAANQIKEAQHP
eukprot:c5121_g1_i1.p1 GENE.c5121_g1_i1~~c5121_g1_i1.p1  ORF type:complete len:159 (+),score=20.06 c5121_g1_i1:178-654(+)